MPARPFVVSAGRALRTGAPERVQVRGPIPDLFVTGSEVPDGADIEVDVELEPVGRTIEAVGTVSAPWQGQCRRCLKPVNGEAHAEVREIFEEEPVEEETYPLRHETVDLEPMAREAIVLELPVAPLCKEDCLGLCPECGADLNEAACSCAPPSDPRWAVLDQLREQ
ncbi:MAG TPA: DUF177 domain-containing protein [Acidimicrobiales bacterium]|nr:DUF177 domain-containing protein [Acidimicrobiales bacterium]